MRYTNSSLVQNIGQSTVREPDVKNIVTYANCFDCCGRGASRAPGYGELEVVEATQ